MKDEGVQIRTKEKQNQLVAQLKRMPIIEVACQKINVGRNSYYRWRWQNKKFAAECDKAIEEGCALVNDLAESQLLTAMKNSNLTAVMYWLNHRHNAYKNKLEVSGGLEIKKDPLDKEREQEVIRSLKLAKLIINNEGDNNEKNKK